MASRSVPKYCCYLQSLHTGAHGSGFVVELKDLQRANLLALNWKKRGKTGELQTDYALITSHDTIPGLSLTDLEKNRWTVSCQGIKNGNEQILSDLICGVISCCGPESLLAGHTSDATVTVFRPHPGNPSCDIQLNITILFLNKLFEVLLQESTVSPPVIPVSEYLEKYTMQHQLIINTGRNSRVSHCNGIGNVETASFSVFEQQRTLEHEQELARAIIEFERFQKLESNTTMEICHGSPVYLNPDTSEPFVIGVYVGRSSASQEGEQLVVTFHGILRLLQGGLIPVLSILQCLDVPKAWTGRWGYLVTPHIDQMKRMECSYVCEVLHFLLKKRLGTPLVKLSVDLVDVDNEASLNLLCALFKHLKSADNADLNEAVTKLNLKNEINAYITRLCRNVIHLLKLGASSMVTDRTSLVEKCLIFYNLLLNIKFAGITEQILGISELLENICHRYKHSDVVQRNATDISLRRSSVETLENQQHYEAYQQALQKGIKIELKCLKMLFFGPPRTGKTSMRRRLVGEIVNLKNEPVQASTGTAEHYDVIVKLFDDKTTYSTTVITKSEWSSVKALFGKEKSMHETDLDDELRLLYQFIYTVVSPTENNSSVSPINKPSNENRPPVPNPVIEKKAQDEFTLKQSPATDTLPNVVPVEPLEAGSNAPISTVKVSSVREHVLNAKPLEEIEKAFKAFDKVLHTGGQEQLKDLLDRAILMNMVDTGGHPAFLEMLPALTMGPALYLIFFRLNQELKSTYQIKYVSESNENIELGDSPYTVEEVIFQALSSIACFSCTEPKENMPNPSHAAMLMGTHKDRLGCNPETVAHEIKIKDAALQKNLREILKTDLKSNKTFLHYASDDQLMFAIDNMTGDEEELIKVRERLEDVIKQEFDDFPIPASWLMFSIFLRKMGKRTMSLSQCREIGERLEVKDTDEALWFLHHYVGILMHFPDVEEVKDIVICDPQVVFDSVTDLILNSFNLKQVSKQACDKFKETGQFSFKDIQKIARNSKSDDLPLPELVKLLEHLNIIAPIRTECHSSSPQSDVNHEVYFMPAVLDHATEEQLLMKQSLTDPVPLMIHFKCGFVPVGVFCAMIACLVTQEDTLEWILQEPEDGHNLCKNKVTFRINGAYNITLISKPKRYEIHIARFSTTDKALEEICQHVVETVCDILDQVIKKMKYKQLISSDSDQTLYELGFKCPRHLNSDHLVINRPKRGAKPPSRSAKSLWLNYLAIESKSTMICLKEGISINLKNTSLSKSFAQQSLVWFGEATEISSASPAKDTCHDIQSHGLKRDQEFSLAKELDVKNIVNVLHEAKFADGDWAELGLQLIDRFDSTTIRVDHGRASGCMSHTISQWLRTDPNTSWKKLAEAVVKVEGYGEATAHIVRQKAGIVHTEVSKETAIKKQKDNDDKPGISGSETPAECMNLHTKALEKEKHKRQLQKSKPKSSYNSFLGVEVVGEEELVVKNEGINFQWKGHGFKLHVPKDALPEGIPEYLVNIKASLAGQFQLPEGYELVSTVYWVATPGSFTKPVTIEIQHCANFKHPNQLRFVCTSCTQRSLPYKFEFIDGGSFGCKYGALSTTHFSGNGIVREVTPGEHSCQYCAQVYFTVKHLQDYWYCHFVVTKDLEMCLTVAKRKYQQEYDIAPPITFGADHIALDIPEDGIQTNNGWEIVPLQNPQIKMDRVDHFSSENTLLPECVLLLKWLPKKKPPDPLEYKIKLLGTGDEKDFFRIIHHPASYMRWHMSLPPLWILVLLLAIVIGAGLWLSGPNSSHLYHSLSPSGSSTISPSTDCHQIARKQDLNTELAEIGDWRSLCTNLEVPEAVINDLEHEHLKNINAKKQNCLSAYFDQGNACWEKVIEVVADHPFHNKRLAKQIAKKYGVTWQE